jgi:hypothetical protein
VARVGVDGEVVCREVEVGRRVMTGKKGIGVSASSDKRLQHLWFDNFEQKGGGVGVLFSVYFHTRNPNWGIFWRALECKILVYLRQFVILWQFGILILWQFGRFYSNLVDFGAIW